MACCKENRIYVSEVVIIRHFIGIDLGTSAVKLLLVDEQGQIEREVTKNIRSSSRTPAGPSRTRRTGGRPYSTASFS